MAAFGGNKFSEEVATKRFARVLTPWFRVVPNFNGTFQATERT